MYAICHFYARKLTKIRYRFDLEFMKDVMVKALPYGIALVLKIQQAGARGALDIHAQNSTKTRGTSSAVPMR